MATSCKVLNNI